MFQHHAVFNLPSTLSLGAYSTAHQRLGFRKGKT
jgi:hypothetical protein